MKVCIIGNSPNLLDKNMGEQIDMCDHVIRINDFVIKGFEKQVGSKTTVVASGFSSVSEMVKGDYSTSDLMDKCLIWVVIPDQGRINRVLKRGVDPRRISVIDNESYNFLRNSIYKNFWRKVPSCGASTIQMALKNFQGFEILIAGFDNNTGDEGKGHYYDDEYIDKNEPGNPVGHDWKSESEYIQHLIDTVMIKRMS